MKVSLFGFILRITKERNYAEAYVTNNNNWFNYQFIIIILIFFANNNSSSNTVTMLFFLILTVSMNSSVQFDFLCGARLYCSDIMLVQSSGIFSAGAWQSPTSIVLWFSLLFDYTLGKHSCCKANLSLLTWLYGVCYI